MKNVLVVSNINKRSKKDLFAKKKTIKFLISSCQLFRFISIDDFDNIDISNFDTIIAMGGDGTIHKILPKIVNTNRVLGIIPYGTANLLASNLGIKTNINKSLEVLNKNNIKYADVMKINDNYSILRFGIGFDYDVINFSLHCLKKYFGYFSYFMSGLFSVFRLKRKKYEIEYDDKIINIDATGVIIANASNMYKNVISIANNSSVNDGLLDVFILKAQNPISFFIEFLKIVLNIKKSNIFAEYFKAKIIKIKNTWCNVHIDGEIQTTSNDINISLVHNAIKVYIP